MQDLHTVWGTLMSGQNKQPSRVTRWTAWELLLLVLSVIMILFPALVTAYGLVRPTNTMAAEGADGRPTSTKEPTGFVPTASMTRTPINTHTSTPTPTT